MQKKIFIILFILFSFSINKILYAEEGMLGMEDIIILSGEDLEEKKDTTKINASEIDITLLDETYIVASQNKDINKAREDRIDLWIKQLFDNDPTIKKDAILVLGRLKEKKAISDLIKIVSGKSEKDEMRSSAAWALGNMGYEILPELEKLVYNEDVKTKIYGIWAIGLTRSKSAIPVLKKIDKEISSEDKITKKAVLNTMKLFDTTLLIPENW